MSDNATSQAESASIGDAKAALDGTDAVPDEAQMEDADTSEEATDRADTEAENEDGDAGDLPADNEEAEEEEEGTEPDPEDDPDEGESDEDGEDDLFPDFKLDERIQDPELREAYSSAKEQLEDAYDNVTAFYAKLNTNEQNFAQLVQLGDALLNEQTAGQGLVLLDQAMRKQLGGKGIADFMSVPQQQAAAPPEAETPDSSGEEEYVELTPAKVEEIVAKAVAEAMKGAAAPQLEQQRQQQQAEEQKQQFEASVKAVAPRVKRLVKRSFNGYRLNDSQLTEAMQKYPSIDPFDAVKLRFEQPLRDFVAKKTRGKGKAPELPRRSSARGKAAKAVEKDPTKASLSDAREALGH